MPREVPLANAFVDTGCSVDWGHPLNIGLQHWWNAVPNLGWRNGSMLRDASRGGGRAAQDGTFTNGGSGLPTWKEGGRSVNFTGSSSYVSLPTSVVTANNAGTAITVAFWFKGSNIQSAVRLQAENTTYIVVGWGGTPNANQIIISSDGATSGLTIGGCEDSNWHHLVFRWIKNTTNGWQWWVDGKINAQKNAGNVNLPTLGSVTYNPCFGQWAGGPGYEPTTGSIRDVKLYNTYANAQQLYIEAKQGNPNTLRWVSTRDWSFPANGGGGGFFGSPLMAIRAGHQGW